MKKLSKLIMLARSFGDLSRPRVDELARIRLMAVREGVWFKALSRLERCLVGLTLKVTNKVRSKVLGEALRSIVRKLREALESKVGLPMRRVGGMLAARLCLIAQRWGNTSAKDWLRDKSFARFLEVMYMNNPGIFKRS